MEIQDIAKSIEKELNTFELMYQECKTNDVEMLSDILNHCTRGTLAEVITLRNL